MSSGAPPPSPPTIAPLQPPPPSLQPAQGSDLRLLRNLTFRFRCDWVCDLQGVPRLTFCGLIQGGCHVVDDGCSWWHFSGRKVKTPFNLCSCGNTYLRAEALVQWLELYAWKVGYRGFEPHYSFQVSEKKNFFSPLIRKDFISFTPT